MTTFQIIHPPYSQMWPKYLSTHRTLVSCMQQFSYTVQLFAFLLLCQYQWPRLISDRPLWLNMSRCYWNSRYTLSSIIIRLCITSGWSNSLGQSMTAGCLLLQFNGMLEKGKTNGKNGGWSEQTLLWNWVMTHLINEHLLSLPEDAHSQEWEMIQSVITTQAWEWGSMMAQIGVYQAEAWEGECWLYTTIIQAYNICLPLKKAKLDILWLMEPMDQLYNLTLTHCQHIWPDLNLIDDLLMEDSLLLCGHWVVKALSCICKDGICYGCATNKKSQVGCICLFQCRLMDTCSDQIFIYCRGQQ